MTALEPVCVILPTFNRAATIERAVRSILGQTHPELQVLVVDDASTDATSSIVAGIADDRVQYLRLPTNAGPAAAPSLRAAPRSICRASPATYASGAR